MTLSSQSPTQRQNRRWPLILRYALFATTFILFLASFLVNLLNYTSIINLIFHSASGLAMLMYVPAAIVLTVRDSQAKFARVKGELGYLGTQIVLWLASTILIIIGLTANNCFGRRGYELVKCHHALIALIIMAVIQLILFTTHASWLIYKAKTNPTALTNVYSVPAHTLLSASPSRGFLPLHSQSKDMYQSPWNEV